MGKKSGARALMELNWNALCVNVEREMLFALMEKRLAPGPDVNDVVGYLSGPEVRGGIPLVRSDGQPIRQGNGRHMDAYVATLREFVKNSEMMRLVEEVRAVLRGFKPHKGEGREEYFTRVREFLPRQSLAD